jgi:hypothetical protein
MQHNNEQEEFKTAHLKLHPSKVDEVLSEFNLLVMVCDKLASKIGFDEARRLVVQFIASTCETEEEFDKLLNEMKIEYEYNRKLDRLAD